MRRWMVLGIGAVIIGGATTAGAIAVAGGGGDSEGRVGGPRADRAIHAALEATGGGSANAVERDGENGAVWEVEVERSGGAIVDVRLDADYRVVVIEGDIEASDTGDNGS
jgi:hypothetical protein